MLNTIRKYGVSVDEAYKAISNLPKILFTEEDIILIRNNPNLNWFQKIRLIKQIKEYVK